MVFTFSDSAERRALREYDVTLASSRRIRGFAFGAQLLESSKALVAVMSFWISGLFEPLAISSLWRRGVPIILHVSERRKPNTALEPTADGAMFFAQEVSGLLGPQVGGGSALSRWVRTMSWVIEIVGVEVADQDDAAWRQLEDLRLEARHRVYGTPPSQRMLALYHRLTERYPCINEDENSPWCDAPLINNFGDKIATIGVVISRIEDTLPFIIDTATGMGFTVFDGGDEKIHRPKNLSASACEHNKNRPWWKFWK